MLFLENVALKDLMIVCLWWHVYLQMESELDRFDKLNTALELNITELRQKLKATDKEMHQERQRVGTPSRFCTWNNVSSFSHSFISILLTFKAKYINYKLNLLLPAILFLDKPYIYLRHIYRQIMIYLNIHSNYSSVNERYTWKKLFSWVIFIHYIYICDLEIRFLCVIKVDVHIVEYYRCVTRKLLWRDLRQIFTTVLATFRILRCWKKVLKLCTRNMYKKIL